MFVYVIIIQIFGFGQIKALLCRDFLAPKFTFDNMKCHHLALGQNAHITPEMT